MVRERDPNIKAMFPKQPHFEVHLDSGHASHPRVVRELGERYEGRALFNRGDTKAQTGVGRVHLSHSQGTLGLCPVPLQMFLPSSCSAEKESRREEQREAWKDK